MSWKQEPRQSQCQLTRCYLALCDRVVRILQPLLQCGTASRIVSTHVVSKDRPGSELYRCWSVPVQLGEPRGSQLELQTGPRAERRSCRRRRGNANSQYTILEPQRYTRSKKAKLNPVVRQGSNVATSVSFHVRRARREQTHFCRRYSCPPRCTC